MCLENSIRNGEEGNSGENVSLIRREPTGEGGESLLPFFVWFPTFLSDVDLDGLFFIYIFLFIFFSSPLVLPAVRPSTVTLCV